MKATLIFGDWLEAIEELTTEERGELLTLILRHLNGEETKPASPAVRGAWGFVRRSITSGAELSEKRRAAGSKGGKVKQNEANGSKVKQNEANVNKHPNTNTNINTNINNIPPIGGVLNAHAPAREEVMDFFKKENSTAEAGAAFYDYWDTENWTRKSGQPLIAWQSAARMWMREEFQRAQETNEHEKRTNIKKNGKTGKTAPRLASAEDFDHDI